jgi:hypothetical protein
MIQQFTNQAIVALEPVGHSDQHPVTLAEMYMFFGLEVACARHPQRNDDFYWARRTEEAVAMGAGGQVRLSSTGSFAGPELSQYGMSRRRFEFIRKHLRLANYSMAQDEAPPGARAWKSYHVMDRMDRNCRDVLGGRCGR